MSYLKNRLTNLVMEEAINKKASEIAASIAEENRLANIGKLSHLVISNIINIIESGKFDISIMRDDDKAISSVIEIRIPSQKSETISALSLNDSEFDDIILDDLIKELKRLDVIKPYQSNSVHVKTKNNETYIRIGFTIQKEEKEEG